MTQPPQQQFVAQPSPQANLNVPQLPAGSAPQAGAIQLPQVGQGQTGGIQLPQVGQQSPAQAQ